MRDGAAAPVVAQTIIAPACPQEAWFQLLTLKSKTANSIEPHGLPMMMDAVLELFWPELGHNFSAGLNLQLRPNCQREIVQIDLGIYMRPLQRMHRRPERVERWAITTSSPAWSVAAATLEDCRRGRDSPLGRMQGCIGHQAVLDVLQRVPQGRGEGHSGI